MNPIKENIEAIEVKVRPEYIISQSNDLQKEHIFIWAYHVKIANKSNETVQLISRYWKVIDEKGGVQEVSGEGVIGEQPILTPGSNFNYSSGVNLNCSSGIMSGHYIMKKDDGTSIKVIIPAFSLDIPNTKSVIN